MNKLKRNKYSCRIFPYLNASLFWMQTWISDFWSVRVFGFEKDLRRNFKPRDCEVWNDPDPRSRIRPSFQSTSSITMYLFYQDSDRSFETVVHGITFLTLWRWEKYLQIVTIIVEKWDKDTTIQISGDMKGSSIVDQVLTQ